MTTYCKLLPFSIAPKSLHQSKSDQSSCALLVDSRSRHASLHLFAPRVACGPNHAIYTVSCSRVVTCSRSPPRTATAEPIFQILWRASCAAHGTHSHSHHPCNDVCVHSYLIDSAGSHSFVPTRRREREREDS
jgi:hypothetical protein